ncbi:MULTISPECIES: hypothetical protein [Cyanophyceae]|uniref:hypothetical protein n=1 Tax=Cyanophyceae TaxID=3028117 RepID=UPI00016DCA57|nr:MULTISPECIES: hypothetical protein [Cyanophyceae]ACA99603.1 conserved hypothetical protein [Picosynechococcus sp. PCC 7002]SMH29238.1 hypothetical protein SAMN06272755_0079 [Picosynechococcus sp. OG1]SMQ83672.1 hypothetical protein SAMN06272774_2456 [Synechococcus sp. 7002]
MGESIPEQQAIAETIALLEYYGFELNGQTAAATIEQWCAHSPVAWVRLAVLEALYRGRYKKISVTAILRVWQRWEKPQVQFNREFESLICAELPTKVAPTPPAQSRPEASIASALPSPSFGIATFSPPPELANSDAYQKLKAIATQPDTKKP